MSNSRLSDSERPPYQLLLKLAENIEIRKYSALKWACTKQTGRLNQYQQFQNGMFYKLFNYISGANNKNQKILMTTPVTVSYKNHGNNRMNKETNCDMEMRFYVPRNMYANTPVPIQDAYLKEESEMIVAVIMFGGYASEDDYIQYRDLLVARLGNEAQKYDTFNMMTAGYDPPYKQFNRLNEVWLRKI